MNRLDEPVVMAVPKPMLTEFGIYYLLESCDQLIFRQLLKSERILYGFEGILVFSYSTTKDCNCEHTWTLTKDL